MEGKETAFWKNFDHPVGDMIEQKFDIYGSEMIIRVIPEEGWQGTSSLFYLIALLGVIASSLSAFGVNKVLSINATLESANEELEGSIKRIVESESKLKKQYEQIKRQEQYIKFLADHDALTGLANRRQFIEVMENELSNNRSGAMVLLDLDNFKNINDTMGHVYGDKILIYISGLIEESLGETASVFRLGGDEFIILIKDIADHDRINEYIGRVVDKLAEGIEVNETLNYISASFGVSIYPTDGVTVEELMVKADIAMYSAKNSGKNLTKFFVQNMVSVFEQRVQIEKKLHQTLENDGFELNYQPIVKTDSGEIVSFEALLRMKDRSMGPAEFIPVAEETGLIVSIGRWVMETVVEQLIQWHEKGISIKPIAINLSPKQINDAALLTTLKNYFKEGRISPKWLDIEITENVLIENSMDNIRVLKAIKEMGVKISLDDFGTGYSSLNYLTFMPVDQVKLDKALKDKFINNNEAGIMDGLVSIAHGLGLDVVVEGVETLSEFEKLSGHHCDFMQGYLFSKPVSTEAVESMLRKGVLFRDGSFR
jgi:diguanylate cyclase (GGDEF)-like protein